MKACRVSGTVVLFLKFLMLLHQVDAKENDIQDCSSALGLANGKQPGTKLSASSNAVLFISHFSYQRMIANYGRLNGRFAWCARKPRGSWLMVEFDNVTTVTGIATQGFRSIYNHYSVQKYKVQYSSSTSDWKYVTKNGAIMTFTGNANGFDTIKNDFDAIQAKRIKIIPVKFKYRVCMKVELYGCVKGQSLSQTTTTTKPSSTKMLFSTKSMSITSTPPTMGSNATKTSPRSTPKSSPRSTPKSSPRSTPKSSSRSSPKSSPRSTPKSSPRSTPKSSPRSTPKSSPRSTPKSSPRSTPKSSPRSTPKSSPRSSPKSSPRSTPKSSPRSTPKSSPRSTPKSSPRSTPKSSPRSTPMSSPRSTPKSSPRSTPKSSPRSTPMSSPRSTPKSSPRSTPMSSPRSTPKSSPRSTPKSSTIITAKGHTTSFGNTTKPVNQSKSIILSANNQLFILNNQALLGVIIIVVLIVFIVIPVAVILLLSWQKRRKFKPIQHYGLRSFESPFLDDKMPCNTFL